MQNKATIIKNCSNEIRIVTIKLFVWRIIQEEMINGINKYKSVVYLCVY